MREMCYWDGAFFWGFWAIGGIVLRFAILFSSSFFRFILGGSGILLSFSLWGTGQRFSDGNFII